MAYVKKNLGDTWDKDTDYQAIINDAAKNGDYATAAQAEKLRNQKIDATGSNYNKTNNYSKHLDTDYSVLGQQQMASGASWQDVLDTYNKRFNKATTTAGLEKYAYDDVQQSMWQYVVDNMQKSNQNTNGAQTWLDNYMQANPQPTNEDKYLPVADELLNEILSREDFSYDVANDPLYQQYAEMYQREGDRAAKNTLADAAATAGGMNSYAITAANQAASNYAAQLNDRIPELYQLAYNMYLQDKESDVENLGLLMQMSDMQYGRYRDEVSDNKDYRNFAYGAYQDDVSQGNWQTQFDYNQIVGNRDTALNNSRYAQETAREEVWNLISFGVTPSADLIARAGMNQSDVNLAVAAINTQSTKSSGSIEVGEEDDKGGYKVKEIKPVVDDSSKGVADGMELGIGPRSRELILRLAEAGLITINEDNTAEWNDGWGPSNWERGLKMAEDAKIALPGFNF